MSFGLRVVTVAVLPLLLGQGARGAEVVEWPLEVPRAGAWEVALDAAALAALTPAGAVEVLDPRGRAVPALRFAADRGERCRAIEAAELERAGERWRVRLQVPEGVGPHAALRFELEDAVLASGCRLEALDARGLATELGRADLFRIGEEAALARTRFDYPVTEARELVVSWPAAAGFPRVRAVSVCAPEDEPRRIRMPGGAAPAVPVAGAAARWIWPVPPAVGVLAVEVAASGRAPTEAGYRLRVWTPRGWREIARGRWPLEARTLRLELEGSLSGAEAVALDLEGAVAERLEATWEVEPEAVRFEAAAAGRHTLRIPAAVRPRARVDDEGAALALGAARAAERPLRAPPAGAELPAAGFRRSWSVESAARAGDPVVLELPAEVRAVARRDLADLRLAVDGRLVPARLAASGPPVVLLSVADAAPGESKDGRSRWEVEAPGADRGGEPLQLLLRTSRREAPFERLVQLRVVPPAEGRRAPAARPAGSAAWRCGGDEPVACELAMPVAAPAGARLEIGIDDGDSAPLAALDLELVGRGAGLEFQWPATPPRLYAGASGLGPARFDLAALEAALEAARPVTARTGAALDLDAGPDERWSRILLFGAVGLVALALLALLRRLLPSAGRAG